VYDNLGLETAYKRFRTVLVSDGGQKIDPEPDPHRDWARHAYRINELIDNQVRSLRKRQLIDSFRSGTRTGTYWGIRTNIADYGLGQVLDAPFDRTLQLAATPTRLRAIELPLQERLMNWGYAVCDAALRAHVNHALPEGAFPFSTKP
jgi:NTE family protein